ncbi:gp53-like domain-containing protein [Pantoea stewartii]|uniref:gp53-like domain-containing protein n=1 Tax=Pantoea stewartii TaxID=66269 RepID=UPI001130AC90|nr:hypothetical protein [Pantoea stewartii]KAB0545595.1 hypothetical protein F7Q90_24160 [Pantoea stewartii subsp. stewartii]
MRISNLHTPIVILLTRRRSDATTHATPDSLFHNGNPLTGEKGTIVTATFLNNTQGAIRDAQSELINILTAAGIVPDSAKGTQVLSALKKILLTRSNPFSDIASDGQVAIDAALKNLGLLSAAKRDVGTGQTQIPDMSFWTSNQGWRKTPDGFIEQWGISNPTTDTTSVTFPIAFSSSVSFLSEHDNGGGTSVTLWQLNSITLSGFQARNIARIAKGDNAVEPSISANCIWFARGK